MRDELYNIFRKHEESLRHALYTKLRVSDAPHYTLSSPEVLLARVTQLVHTLGNALRRNPHIFTDFAQMIVDERIAEGFSLSEIQMVFSVLEEELWRLCDHEIHSRDDLVRALAIVTTIVGKAKDEAARAYLLHAESSTRAVGQYRHADSLD